MGRQTLGHEMCLVFCAAVVLALVVHGKTDVTVVSTIVEVLVAVNLEVALAKTISGTGALQSLPKPVGCLHGHAYWVRNRWCAFVAWYT